MSASHVLAVLDQAAEYGVDLDELAAVQAARAILANAARIGAALRRTRNGERDDARQLAEALLDGSADVHDVEVASITRAAATDPSGLYRTVERSVEIVANHRALVELAALGDRWIVEVFGPVVATVVDELTQLSQSIPLDCGDRNVHEKPRSIRDQWARAVDVIAAFYGLNGIVDDLRRAGLVPCDDIDDSGWFWFRRIDLLPQHVRVSEQPVLWFLDAIRGGAGPDCLTEQQCRDLLAERNAEPEPAA